MKLFDIWSESRSIYRDFWKLDLSTSGVIKFDLKTRLLRPELNYVYLLRKSEHFYRCASQSGFFKPLYYLFRIRMQFLGNRIGFTVPTFVFDSGLSIAHAGTIVVNKDSIVGKNCRLHAGVTIGAKHGFAPKIGDNCFIGPGAVLIGNITIGNNVRIGPNAVVDFNVEDDSVVTISQLSTRKKNRA